MNILFFPKVNCLYSRYLEFMHINAFVQLYVASLSYIHTNVIGIGIVHTAHTCMNINCNHWHRCCLALPLIRYILTKSLSNSLSSNNIQGTALQCTAYRIEVFVELYPVKCALSAAV